MRTQLIEVARPVLSEMVEQVTGVTAVSLHHDISTLTGEEVILFTLSSRTRHPGSQEAIETKGPSPTRAIPPRFISKHPSIFSI